MKPTERFMRAFRRATKAARPTVDNCPQRRRKSVTVGLYVVDDNTIGFRQITSRRHGKGHGSECLDWLIGLADKYSVSFTGYVEPNCDRHLTLDQLKAWYSRRGFTIQGSYPYEMQRIPPTPTPSAILSTPLRKQISPAL
jgi:hypothetical protein